MKKPTHALTDLYGDIAQARERSVAPEYVDWQERCAHLDTLLAVLAHTEDPRTARLVVEDALRRIRNLPA